MLLLISFSSFAQTISAEVDRDRIFIGEQIVLKLKVSEFNPNSRVVQTWFQLPDTINHLEVVERPNIDTIQVDGIYSLQQRITITSFDSGQWEIPGLTVVVKDRVNNSVITQTTKPLSIQVLPVDVSELKDYHEIKEIIAVEEKNNPLIIGLIAAITILSLFAIYRLSKSRKKVALAKPVIGPTDMSPYEWAISELDKLQRQNLAGKESRAHYDQLTQISRQFFHLQLLQPSLQQTTDEWMVQLQPLRVGHDTKTSFFQVLRLADTVKFAKYIPPATDNEQSITTVKHMLREVVEQQKQFAPNPNAKYKPV
ncbi:protein BatD [Segetibacter sp. 3557_3]|uniref:protein BatD n=1 Tax=Segetibacter sp. 3557_3 TaxID=2547429 RepID=UPI001404BB3B|nr:protein BatD [Segetibacter sp. 3557_3]